MNPTCTTRSFSQTCLANANTQYKDFFFFFFYQLIKINFFDTLQYFKENPDYNNPAYNTKNGIYSEGCGLDNVMISWGHDDYMYLVYMPLALFTYF